jgi:hypothetical protein
MLKRIVLALAMAAAIGPAMAASWDSNTNIDRATAAALKAYRANGDAALIDAANNCYAGLDARPRNPNAGRDVEYCISLDLSALAIDNTAVTEGNAPRSTKLEPEKMMLRAMQALEQARIVRLPEEFLQYLNPRFDKNNADILQKM